MKKIILFNTAIASPNKGDDIIMSCCKKQLKFLLENNYVLELPTHTPISHWYQNFSKFNIGDHYREIDYKFICGTNLFNANMCLPTPLWNINVFNCKVAKGAVAVGVGMGSVKATPNSYTRSLLRKVLSTEYVHSTRDEKTAKFLRGLGFKALNTGCATTWDLTNNFCAEIRGKKAEEVVFTLTDYAKDIEKDKYLLKVLLENYKKVYYWIQGIGDLQYLKEIYDGDQVTLIGPTLEAYDKILEKQIDFIGTRLHAGIRAMQKKCRTIIISVDNRAEDMKKDINLCILPRKQLDNLSDFIYKDIEFQLNIKEKNIEMWRDQFK
ncbi:polysaccharide pyruvyl transferase family protein [Mediterraneibacter sp. ICN-202921]|uniref:polysaccharide pyruvyl transferase family protein n=1 Tax=Mediterraneibacter sp. ICN-202921 TaxID=3134657 RepID=UPI0030BCF046